MAKTPKNINKGLKSGFNELDRLQFNLELDANKRVMQGYRHALDQVKLQLSAIYEKYGDKPTLTQVRKAGRLEKIEQNLVYQINELNIATKGTISDYVDMSASLGYLGSADVVELSTGLNALFNPVFENRDISAYASDNLWIDSLNNHNGKLVADVKREVETVLRANSREEIIAGIAEGKSYGQVISAIQERFEVTAGRASVITFTEMHKAHSYERTRAIQESMKAADEIGVKVKKVWRHNAVGKPRPDHIAADGQTADEEGMFHVGGEALPGPGLGTDPANNIGCHCSSEMELDETPKAVQAIEKQAQKEEKAQKEKPASKKTSDVPKKAEPLKGTTKKKADKAVEPIRQTLKQNLDKKIVTSSDTSEISKVFQKFEKENSAQLKELQPLCRTALEKTQTGISGRFETSLGWKEYKDKVVPLSEKYHQSIVDALNAKKPGLGTYYHTAIQDWYHDSSSTGAGMLKYMASQAQGTQVVFHSVPVPGSKHNEYYPSFIDSDKNLMSKYEAFVKVQGEAIVKGGFTPQDLKEAAQFVSKANADYMTNLFGTDTFTVYRGVNSGYFDKIGMDPTQLKIDQTLKIADNAAASWSLSPYVGDSFGDIMMEARVHVSDVLSSIFSAPGGEAESELIVMFKNNTADVKIVKSMYDVSKKFNDYKQSLTKELVQQVLSAPKTSLSDIQKQADKLFSQFTKDYAAEVKKVKEGYSKAFDKINKNPYGEALFGALDIGKYGDAVLTIKNKYVEMEVNYLNSLKPNLGSLYKDMMENWYNPNEVEGEMGAGLLKYLSGKQNKTKVYYQKIPQDYDNKNFSSFIDSSPTLESRFRNWVEHGSLWSRKNYKDLKKDDLSTMFQFMQRSQQNLVKEILGKDTVTLYRGVKKEYFTRLKTDVSKYKKGQEIVLAENSAASWSLSPNAASKFGDVVFKVEVKMEDVLHSIFGSKGFDDESEIVVAFKNNTVKAVIDHI